MNNANRKRTRKDTLRAAAYLPRLETLEERWMPGDTVLSGFLAQAVLRPGSANSERLSSMGGG